MKNIRITLIRSLPRIKLFIDRFVESVRIRIHHIDYATDRMSAFFKIQAKIISLNIEKALVNAGVRFPTPFFHVDYDASTMSVFQKMQIKIHSIDVSINKLKASLIQYAKIRHSDFDASHVSAMLVYPVLLGELADMTLGEMTSETLGDLTFNEIQI